MATQRGALDGAIRIPWKPGRAPVWRVWVAVANSGGWLEDDDLALAESELSRSGIRGLTATDHRLMTRGDVVWDLAVGSERNDGKFLYDGDFIRYVSLNTYNSLYSCLPERWRERERRRREKGKN